MIIDTVVNHQTTVQECYNQPGTDHHGSIARVYGTDGTQYAHGTIVGKIVETVINGGLKSESALGEWSGNRCDYCPGARPTN